MGYSEYKILLWPDLPCLKLRPNSSLNGLWKPFKLTNFEFICCQNQLLGTFVKHFQSYYTIVGRSYFIIDNKDNIVKEKDVNKYLLVNYICWRAGGIIHVGCMSPRCINQLKSRFRGFPPFIQYTKINQRRFIHAAAETNKRLNNYIILRYRSLKTKAKKVKEILISLKRENTKILNIIFVLETYFLTKL